MKFGRKNYVENRVYKFSDLPSDTQHEVEAQLVEGKEPEDFEYHFTIIPLNYFSEVLREGFRSEYDDWASNPRVYDLAKSIKKNGLKAPPVGNEGNHRAFAMEILKRDLPYFLMVNRKTAEPYNNIYGLVKE